MSSWLGFRNVSGTSTLTFAVNTHSASTGAATDATGDPTYRVYEDETGTPILTGTMAKLDDANTIGFYSEELTISSGNGFEAGRSYTIYISATVGSVTGTTERHFACWPATINSQIDSNVVQINGDATAAANLEKAADGSGYNLGGGFIVAASVSGAVNSVTSAVTVGTINADVITASSIAEGAAQEIANTVWSADMDDAYGGTSWGNDTLGQRILKSNDQQSYVSITGSHHVAADVHDFQTDVLTADAIDSTAITEIAQGVLTEATSTNTATYAAGDVGNVLGRLHNMIEADGVDFRYTTNALEQAPSGGGGGGGTWELNAEQTTGLKRMISAIVGVGGETATPGVLEFDMIGETTTLRITQSTDGNDRLSVEEV